MNWLANVFTTSLNIAGRIFYETHLAPLLRMQGFFNEVALDFVTANGERLPVLVNAVERRGSDANVLFTRLTIFNATDRRRYERELVEARAAAEDAKKQVQSLNDDLERRIREALSERIHVEGELTQSKTLEVLAQERLRKEVALSELREQFIAVLGHDLRNPLAAISSASALLLRQPQSEKSVAVIGMMRSSVVRMSALIDNLLDFARARMGLGFSLTKIAEDSLKDTLNEVLDEFKSIAPERTFEAAFSITKSVSFDKSRIAQLFSNLLSNALTYGSADKPIRLSASTNFETLELSVANAGEQISEDAKERLF
jgi:sigma-B regulation protein RsbU (phosphoserine phosphatase)